MIFIFYFKIHVLKLFACSSWDYCNIYILQYNIYLITICIYIYISYFLESLGCVKLHHLHSWFSDCFMGGGNGGCKVKHTERHHNAWFHCHLMFSKWLWRCDGLGKPHFPEMILSFTCYCCLSCCALQNGFLLSLSFFCHEWSIPPW